MTAWHLVRAAVCVMLGVVTTIAVAWVIALRIDVDSGESAWQWRFLTTDEGGEFTRGNKGALLVERLTAFGSLRQRAEAGGASTVRQDLRPQGNPESLVSRWALPLVLPWVHGRERWPGYAVHYEHEGRRGARLIRDDRRDIDARGWPWPALWCSYSVPEPRGSQAGPAPFIEGGFRPPSWLEPPFARNRYRIRGLRVAYGLQKPFAGAIPCRPVWPWFACDVGVYAGAWAGVLFGLPAARRAWRRRRQRCPRCAYDLRGLPAGSPCPECGGRPPDTPVAVVEAIRARAWD